MGEQLKRCKIANTATDVIQEATISILPLNRVQREILQCALKAS